MMLLLTSSFLVQKATLERNISQMLVSAPLEKCRATYSEGGQFCTNANCVAPRMLQPLPVCETLQLSSIGGLSFGRP